jgi:hypothetical protein
MSEARKKGFAGAEAHADFEALAAVRAEALTYQSCPVTELTQISAGLSFSAACSARTFEASKIERDFNP